MDKKVENVIYVVFDEFENSKIGNDTIEVGKIYRCLVTPDERYRVETEKYKGGVVFDEKNAEEDYGHYSFREVSMEDILDMDLPDKELDKIINWEKEENNDLFNIGKYDGVIQEDLHNKIKSMIDESAEESKKRAIARTDSFNLMAVEDPLYQESILDLVHYVMESSLFFKDQEDALSEAMRYSQVTDSNIFESVNYLDLYKKTSELDYIYMAMHALVTEVKRRKITL